MFYYIVSEEITLKILTKHHAAELHNLIDRNRDFLGEWLPWVESKRTVEDMEASIEKWGLRYITDSAINAGIFFKDELAGMIAFPEINWSEKKTSFGYWLAPDFERKGIMTKCVKALINHAFQDLELERIEISCTEENVKSRALPEKLGFAQERILYDHYYLHGKVHNLVVYRLLKSI